MRPFHVTLVLALAGLAAVAPAARADWPEAIPDDLALVEPAGLTKRAPVAAEDGAGGAYVGFQTSDFLLHVQHVDASGSVVGHWTSTATVGLEMYAIAADGAGGAYLAWGSGGYAWVTRLGPDAAAVAGWPSSGVMVNALPGGDEFAILPDDAGVYVAFPARVGSAQQPGVRLARLTAAGAAAAGWPAGGRSWLGGTPRIAPGPDRSVYLMWLDTQVRVTRVLPTAQQAAGWPSAGIPLGAGQPPALLEHDGLGGVHAAWNVDARASGVDPNQYDTHGMHLSAAGTPAAGWEAGPRALVATAASELPQVALHRADGGLLLVSTGGDLGLDPRGHAFASDGSTEPGWPADGRPLGAGLFSPRLWDEGPSGYTLLAASGALLLHRRFDRDLRPVQAVATVGEFEFTYFRFAASRSAADGAVVAAWDYNLSGVSDIHAKRVRVDGSLGGNSVTAAGPARAPGLALEAPAPNPLHGGAARLAFALPRASRARLEAFDLGGRRVRVLADGPLPAGRHEAAWDGRGDDGARLPAGLYLLRLGTPDGVRMRRCALLP